VHKNHKLLAGVMFEPVQGEAGIKVHSQEYMDALFSLAKR